MRPENVGKSDFRPGLHSDTSGLFGGAQQVHSKKKLKMGRNCITNFWVIPAISAFPELKNHTSLTPYGYHSFHFHFSFQIFTQAQAAYKYAFQTDLVKSAYFTI